ncbi:hypothetical protein [Novosphingobium cyanobacteriorum]|uniref:Uncharacterized protein n=1 Tax=Novosphingobium cyanobacteriorum TaxID=3024215 RepID=A0ABT6CNQ5_9SPHN|nr:hypothetical protein [Novosphingobium cyanobacteriorum]MDF8335548.1 hypothetical protein [Novosphingobium cyanobacteriorum]
MTTGPGFSQQSWRITISKSLYNHDGKWPLKQAFGTNRHQASGKDRVSAPACNTHEPTGHADRPDHGAVQYESHTKRLHTRSGKPARRLRAMARGITADRP